MSSVIGLMKKDCCDFMNRFDHFLDRYERLLILWIILSLPIILAIMPFVTLFNPRKWWPRYKALLGASLYFYVGALVGVLLFWNQSKF
jgi:hypothetical protein